MARANDRPDLVGLLAGTIMICFQSPPSAATQTTTVCLMVASSGLMVASGSLWCAWLLASSLHHEMRAVTTDPCYPNTHVGDNFVALVIETLCHSLKLELG